jgi:TPR repeat protein
MAGVGVEIDYVKAMQWYKHAADLGSEDGKDIWRRFETFVRTL